MKYRAILFDMDGTLVPMNMDEFINGYFKGLFKKLAHHGIEQKALIDAVWTGTGAMVKNDGSCTNEERFWKTFEAMTGFTREQVNDDCLDFYGNEFHEARQFTGENPLAKEAVKLAHEKAEIVALATNPLFPMVGQITRMNWVGLTPDCFDLVTSYESDRFCKPNPAYFLSVCERLGVKPSECLLIGNDEGEDMYAGSQAGLDCYLVTDSVIKNEKHPWDGPQGSFEDLIELLKQL